MTVSELINYLLTIEEDYGDIPVLMDHPTLHDCLIELNEVCCYSPEHYSGDGNFAYLGIGDNED